MGWCPGQPRVGLFEGDAGGVWPPRSLSPPAAQFLRLGWRWLSISAGAPAPRSLVRDRPGGLSQGARQFLVNFGGSYCSGKQAVRFEGQRSRSSNLLSSPSVHLLPWDPRGFEGTGPRPPTCWGLFLAPARTSPTALRTEGLWSRPPLPAR